MGLPAVGYGTSYTGIWSAYQAISHIYHGYDWGHDVINPPSQFLTDVANGKLRTVSWVTPTCANPDQTPAGGSRHRAFVGNVLVNAVGTSKYWDSTCDFHLLG